MAEFNIDNILRNNVKKLVPYSSARSEFEGDAQIFLDANENSLGSSIDVNYNRYPDPLQKQLKQKLSTLKTLQHPQVLRIATTMTEILLRRSESEDR